MENFKQLVLKSMGYIYAALFLIYLYRLDHAVRLLSNK